MVNSEFVVTDPISFVPMVLLVHVMTLVGKTHTKFSLAKKDSFLSLALLIEHSFCKRRAPKKATEKLQDLTAGMGKKRYTSELERFNLKA
jgi:hypothetical protein